MASVRTHTLVGYLHQLARGEALEPCTDAELVLRFARARDEAAFAALVRRHGALVWGVCRRVLSKVQDAEDAFQATFLVFARQASSVRRPEGIAHWLHGVAYRVANKIIVDASRRRVHEERAFH